MVTDISQLDPKGTYTYADYLKWRFDESVELIRGHLYRMSPAPRTRHQMISSELHSEIKGLFGRNGCRVLAAPFDVRLPNPDYSPGLNEKVYTVVQPDISIICDRAKLDDMGCLGAPDWVIEITSPSTQKKDFNEKFNLYESAGVREYWVIVPESQTINVYALDGGLYTEVAIYEKTGQVQSVIFPNIQLDVALVFAD